MHVRSASLVLALAVGAAACSADREESLAPQPDVAQVEALAAVQEGATHLVVFKSSSVPADFNAAVEALGGKVEMEAGKLGVASVSGLSAEAATKLQKRSGIMHVEVDDPITYEKTLVEPMQIDGAAIGSQAAPQTAVVFARQWNMRQISAPQAWAAGHVGSPSVTIAILDTGIDYLSADLTPVVDLSRSVSFVPSDDALLAAVFPGTHPIADMDGHGTNVATQASSAAVYFAGVGSRTTLMGVKVCGFVVGNCPTVGLMNGIVYAVDNGADVINMSLGGGFLKRDLPGYVAVLNRALQYAEKNNVVLVVSAGNEALDLDHTPNLFKTYCSASHVICVSATGPNSSGAANVGPFPDADQPAFYTNFGRSSVSVAAPGGNYVPSGNSYLTAAWVWSVCPKTMLAIQGGQLFYTTCSAFPQNVYANGYAGTSQASPHVAGLAALLIANGVTKPSQIRNAISKGADDLGQRGTDPYYGKGRINVAKTLGL